MATESETIKGEIKMRKGTRTRSTSIAWLLGIVAMIGAMLLASGCSSGGSDKDNAAAAPAAMAISEQAPGEAMAVAGNIGLQDQYGNNAAVANAVPSALHASATEPAMSASQSAMGSIGPIADADAAYGRKVVYQANLVMKVENFQAADEQLMNLIHMTSGAYVLEFADSRNGEDTGASYVIKVPSKGFSAFLDGLKGIKTVHSERKVSGNDVTEEYVDLDARLKAKQTVEARLLAFMDKATKTDDLVRFSNELGNVQQEIEQIKGRIRYLDQNVAFSTVSLRLYQGVGANANSDGDEPKAKSFGDRVYDALSGSADALRKLGEGLLVVLAAMLPVLAVATVVGVPLFLIVRKRAAVRKTKAEERRRELLAYNRELERTNGPDRPGGEEGAHQAVDSPSDAN